VPRGDFRGLARQFFRYGKSRAATVRKHPASIAPRQLAAPLLLVGLLSRWRRLVAAAYAIALGSEAIRTARRYRPFGAGFALAAPVMHLSWGAGFLIGLVAPRRS
jgi:succinoglycan biosynthesis protein ExoA